MKSGSVHLRRWRLVARCLTAALVVGSGAACTGASKTVKRVSAAPASAQARYLNKLSDGAAGPLFVDPANSSPRTMLVLGHHACELLYLAGKKGALRAMTSDSHHATPAEWSAFLAVAVSTLCPDDKTYLAGTPGAIKSAKASAG